MDGLLEDVNAVEGFQEEIENSELNFQPEGSEGKKMKGRRGAAKRLCLTFEEKLTLVRMAEEHGIKQALEQWPEEKAVHPSLLYRWVKDKDRIQEQASSSKTLKKTGCGRKADGEFEEKVAEWIRSTVGDNSESQLTTDDVRQFAATIAPFKTPNDRKMSHSWFRGFIRRNPWAERMILTKKSRPRSDSDEFNPKKRKTNQLSLSESQKVIQQFDLPTAFLSDASILIDHLTQRSMIADLDAAVEDLYPAELFEEPADFRPPSPPPTTEAFQRDPECVLSGDPSTLVVNLVGKHSLWGHRLWNAGKSMCKFLDHNPGIYLNKNVIEFGAGASLPSIICALNGAKTSVSTDYPDPALIQNIVMNAAQNARIQLENGAFVAKGFIWGQDSSDLLQTLGSGHKFDVVLMADLIFNHSEHHNLLRSCKELLSDDGVIITTFTHHVVKWADRDMKFFAVASELGFDHELVFQEKWDCMFPDDEGDEDIRSTVSCYRLWRAVLTLHN